MNVEQLSEKRQTLLATARELASNDGDLAQVKSIMAEADGIAQRIEAIKSLGEMAPVAKPAEVSEPWKAGSIARNPFTGTRDEANFKAYAFGQWLRSLAGNRKSLDWVKNNIKTQVEGTVGAGGATVPDPLSADLVYLREQFGIGRQNCRIYPMSSDTLSVPNAITSTTVRWPGENAAITDSDMGFASSGVQQINLTAKKMAVLTQVSRELSEDSIIDFGATLARDFAYVLAREEDKVIFNNVVDATSGIDGCIYAVWNLSATKANIAGLVQFDTARAAPNTFKPTISNLSAMVGKLPTYATNAKWYMHKEIFHNTVAPQLEALNGNNWEAIANAYGPQPMLFGYPVVFVQNMVKTIAASTPYILLGDLSVGTAFGDRRGVTVEVSDQRYFESDLLAFKATERFAFKAFDAGNESATASSRTPGALIVGASSAT
jgi:HK97 family phage major capsid protein